MRGHLAAIRRVQAQQTAHTVHATRVAVCGEAKDVQKFLGALEGKSRREVPLEEDPELLASMAAFGIPVEALREPGGG